MILIVYYPFYEVGTMSSPIRSSQPIQTKAYEQAPLVTKTTNKPIDIASQRQLSDINEATQAAPEHITRTVDVRERLDKASTVLTKIDKLVIGGRGNEDAMKKVIKKLEILSKTLAQAGQSNEEVAEGRDKFSRISSGTIVDVKAFQEWTADMQHQVEEAKVRHEIQVEVAKVRHEIQELMTKVESSNIDNKTLTLKRLTAHSEALPLISDPKIFQSKLKGLEMLRQEIEEKLAPSPPTKRVRSGAITHKCETQATAVFDKMEKIRKGDLKEGRRNSILKPQISKEDKQWCRNVARTMMHDPKYEKLDPKKSETVRKQLKSTLGHELEALKQKPDEIKAIKDKFNSELGWKGPRSEFSLASLELADKLRDKLPTDPDPTPELSFTMKRDLKARIAAKLGHLPEAVKKTRPHLKAAYYDTAKASLLKEAKAINALRESIITLTKNKAPKPDIQLAEKRLEEQLSGHNELQMVAHFDKKVDEARAKLANISPEATASKKEAYKQLQEAIKDRAAVYLPEERLLKDPDIERDAMTDLESGLRETIQMAQKEFEFNTMHTNVLKAAKNPGALSNEEKANFVENAQKHLIEVAKNEKFNKTHLKDIAIIIKAYDTVSTEYFTTQLGEYNAIKGQYTKAIENSKGKVNDEVRASVKELALGADQLKQCLDVVSLNVRNSFSSIVNDAKAELSEIYTQDSSLKPSNELFISSSEANKEFYSLSLDLADRLRFNPSATVQLTATIKEGLKPRIMTNLAFLPTLEARRKAQPILEQAFYSGLQRAIKNEADEINNLRNKLDSATKASDPPFVGEFVDVSGLGEAFKALQNRISGQRERELVEKADKEVKLIEEKLAKLESDPETTELEKRLVKKDLDLVKRSREDVYMPEERLMKDKNIVQQALFYEPANKIFKEIAQIKEKQARMEKHNNLLQKASNVALLGKDDLASFISAAGEHLKTIEKMAEFSPADKAIIKTAYESLSIKYFASEYKEYQQVYTIYQKSIKDQRSVKEVNDVLQEAIKSENVSNVSLDDLNKKMNELKLRDLKAIEKDIEKLNKKLNDPNAGPEFDPVTAKIGLARLVHQRSLHESSINANKKGASVQDIKKFAEAIIEETQDRALTGVKSAVKKLDSVTRQLEDSFNGISKNSKNQEIEVDGEKKKISDLKSAASRELAEIFRRDSSLIPPKKGA